MVRTIAICSIQNRFGGLTAFRATGSSYQTVPLGRWLSGGPLEIIGLGSASPTVNDLRADLAKSAFEKEQVIFNERLFCDRGAEAAYVNYMFSPHQKPGWFFGMESSFPGLLCNLAMNFREFQGTEAERKTEAKKDFIYYLKSSDQFKSFWQRVLPTKTDSYYSLNRGIGRFLQATSKDTLRLSMMKTGELITSAGFDAAWQALHRQVIQRMMADEANTRNLPQPAMRAFLENPGDHEKFDIFFDQVFVRWRHPFIVRNIAETIIKPPVTRGTGVVVLTSPGEEAHLRFELMFELFLQRLNRPPLLLMVREILRERINRQKNSGAGGI